MGFVLLIPPGGRLTIARRFGLNTLQKCDTGKSSL